MQQRMTQGTKTMFHIDNLVKNKIEIEPGRWVVIKPSTKYMSVKMRIRDAWNVFNGRAIAVIFHNQK